MLVLRFRQRIPEPDRYWQKPTGMGDGCNPVRRHHQGEQALLVTLVVLQQYLRCSLGEYSVVILVVRSAQQGNEGKIDVA